jgi:hypothetical protein
MRIQKATKFDVRMKPQIQITGPNATLRLDNAAPAQRRAVHLSDLHMQLKPFVEQRCKSSASRSDWAATADLV